MPVLHWMVLALEWLIAAGWLWRVLVWRRMLQRVPDLVQTQYGGSLPGLSVIVPARNEARNIAATLRSLQKG
jgi:cellulose synthase/poly-beta-1,6-N-acetylglucosamine synthase-like glycosyltransferase